MTEVGARCPVCAPRRKLPQLEIRPLYLLRALGGALVSGALLGAAWGLVLPAGLGFFAIFVGMGLGYGVAESVSVATNRKFGPPLQMLASVGVLLAFVVRNIVLEGALFISGDLFAYVSVVAGIFVAVNRLRF